MTDTIEKTITVPLRPKEAFDLFTDKISDWWPTDTHSLSARDGDLPEDVKVEPRIGGHIVETKPDGDTGRWGTVTRWEPGSAFGVSWYVGRPEEQATDLLVVFTPTDTGTRIDLTHGGFDRLAETGLHQQYLVGWDLVLKDRFETYVLARISVATAAM